MKTFFKKAAVMTLAVLASAVILDVSPVVNAEAASTEGDCQVNHAEAAAWTGGGFTADGSYFLTDEVTLSAEIEITGNVTLCLNGQTIKAAKDSRIFTVKNGGKLTLCDCQENGKITGGAPTDETDSNDNIIPSRGGAVRVEKDGEFTMYGGTISDNKAKEGAGVYNSGTFTMNGGTISDNTAVYQGGGVYNSNSSTFTMSNGSTISRNVVSVDDQKSYGGGGVYTAGIFTMNDDCTISDNTAEYCYGGGVCVSIGGEFTMSGDSTISGNKANYWYGGGVYVSGGTFNMEGGTIIKNEAAESGGGVCLGDRPGTEFTMSSGTISENTAKNGGGVHVVSGTVNITDGTINKNEASNGGGVYVSGGTVNVTDGTITANKASKNGGGAYVGNGTFNMADGTIDKNEASNHGGGVHINGGMFEMTGGEIVENNAVKGGGGACLNDGTMLLDGSVTIKSNEMADSSASNVYLMKHVGDDGKLDKDKTITIGERFDTAEKIGVHASISPNCKDYINAAEFAEGAEPKDNIGEYFKPDVDKDVVYDEETDVLKLSGWHKTTKKDAVAATCTENGSAEHWDCSVCEKMFEDEECTIELETVTVVPATGHDYGEWIVIKKPDLTTEGTAERICANDASHKESMPIPPLSGNTGNTGNNSSDSSNSGNSSSSGDSDSGGSTDNTGNGTDNNNNDVLENVTDNPATGIAISLVPLAAAIISFTVTIKRNKK